MPFIQKLFKKEKQIENKSNAATELEAVLKGNNSSAALENTRWFGVCLTKNAETIAETKFVLRSKENPEKVIEDHEIIDRFNMPNTGENNNNRSLNFSKLLYLMYQSYIITGNVYIEKLIDGQWNFLDATRVKPEYDQGGTEILYYRVTTSKGQQRSVATQNMFHYETPEKLSYIQKIQDLLNINKVLFDFTQTFYANGGFIGDVFETEHTTEEQLRKMKAKFENSHQGVETANKVLFLPRGIKIIPRNSGNGNRVSHEEKMANREDIFAAMGTPLSIVGITKSGSSRADSESKERTYKLNMAKPWVDGAFAFFNERITKEYDETGQLYLEPIITYPKDTEANRADAIAMLGGNNTDPFGTLNEARERMSLPPREGMDIVPTRDAGQVIAGKIKNNTLKIDSPLDKLTMALVGAKKKVRHTEENQHICDHTCKHNHIENQYTEEELERARRQVARRNRAESTNLKKFDNIALVFNERFKQRFLEKFDRLFTNNVARELVDEDAEKQLLIQLILPLSEEVLAEVGQAEIEDLGNYVFRTSDPAVQAQLKTYLEPVARSYVSTTTKVLVDVVEEALDDGLGTQEMKRRFNDVFEFADNVRATRLARTVTSAASNQGAYSAFEQSGVVKSVRWVNPSPCEYCEVFVRRGAVPLGHNYALRGENLDRFVGGEIVAGAESQTAFTDIKYPPAHPNCQCSVVVAEFN